MGSSTSVAAICATRSRTVGMPSGRCRPSPFGMYRRRTGGGRYVPARSTAASSFSMRSTPYCSTSASVSPSTPAAPRFPSVHAATPPRGCPPSRSNPSGRGSAVPALAWLRPRVGVAIGALCQRAHARRGGWNRASRSCPRACLRHRQDHRRDPWLLSRSSSRGSWLLWSPRTPAAHGSLSPSVYTSRVAPTPGCADGPLVFHLTPCTRAAPHTPPRPAARTSPDSCAPGMAFAAR